MTVDTVAGETVDTVDDETVAGTNNGFILITGRIGVGIICLITGGGNIDATTIDPNTYDNAGVTASIAGSNNQATNQRISGNNF